jgi:predicted outer membrane protein
VDHLPTAFLLDTPQIFLALSSFSRNLFKFSELPSIRFIKPNCVDWEIEMKAKLLTAAIMSLFVAGCGGGGGGESSTASTNPSGSSGANQTGTGTSGTSAATTPVSSSGAEYLNETAQVSQSQAQQSQVVVQKTSNPEVQALAQQLNTEVNVINQQVTQVSQNNNVTINNNVTNQQQINTINNLSGSELDRAYLTGLVDSWKDLLASTLAQARQATNLQVKQTATTNILVIDQRLVAAKELLFVLQPSRYLADAYQAGLLEIQLGQLALQKTTNAQVRQFAQRMIDNHTQMNSRVTAVAQQENVTLPSTLSAAQQAILTSVSDFSGADFDKAYMDHNVFLHAEVVSKTTVVTERVSDAEIKALAAESLPILQAHLQLAQSIETGLQASQLYQLGQTLITEMQIAQLALVQSTNTQIRTLAQQIITENQASYAQLVQLAQQRNVTIPLVIRPGRVPAVLNLLRARGANTDSQLLSLISVQTSQSLQVAQSAQADNDTSVSSFARARASGLQSRNTQLTQSSTGTDTTNTGTTGTGTTNTGTTNTGTTNTGTTNTGTTNTGTTNTGTTNTGTTNTGTTNTGTTSTGTTDTGTTDTGTTGTGTTGTGTTNTTGTGTTGTDTTGTGTTGTGTPTTTNQTATVTASTGAY